MAADKISSSIWSCSKGSWRGVWEVRNLIQGLGGKGARHHIPGAEDCGHHTRTVASTLAPDSRKCLLSRYCLQLALHSRNGCNVISWNPAPITVWYISSSSCILFSSLKYKKKKKNTLTGFAQNILLRIWWALQAPDKSGYAPIIIDTFKCPHCKPFCSSPERPRTPSLTPRMPFYPGSFALRQSLHEDRACLHLVTQHSASHIRDTTFQRWIAGWYPVFLFALYLRWS